MSVSRQFEHPFAKRWNHNTHYFPLLAASIPAEARRILDIGCGDGTFCDFVAAEGRSVLGVDVDLAVLPRRSGSVSFAAASLTGLGLASDSFDAVVMCMVLHHVDGRQGLTEAARVLAPGGTLLVLGYGRFGGVRDLPYEVRDVVVHRLVARRMQAWEPGTRVADPRETWSGTRSTAQRVLLGCTYRRLPMWRYLVEWTKPWRRRLPTQPAR